VAPEDPRHTVDPLGNFATGERAAAIAVKVAVVAGPDEGREVALSDTVGVGTEPGADLLLSDPAVSRRHCSFTLRGDRIRIKDLGSRNGTFLGGTRVHEADVPVGAVLALGDTTLAIQPRWYTREVAPSAARRFGEVIGESVAMREVFAILERVAPSEVTVLIEGETGTGKELVARSIHRASARAEGPYVVFDCGSIPSELVESELFGHRRGAFSGAVADRNGALQQADGGTFCLDEIGELPLELQPKLLRVLETGEIRRVGDDVMREVDVRILASTNRDLHAEAQRGRFRSDLLYRLAVVKIRMPPLRQRPGDVPPLVAHLLDGVVSAEEEIGGDNLDRLLAYSWPGNVRELRNALERAVALANRPGQPPRFSDLVFNLGPMPDEPLTLGPSYPGVESPMPYKEAKAQLLASFERAYIEALLPRHGGNVSRAAAAAGLSRKHLYDLIGRSGDDEDE
jgi:DNA-binding NtrC family response regulator